MHTPTTINSPSIWLKGAPLALVVFLMVVSPALAADRPAAGEATATPSALEGEERPAATATPSRTMSDPGEVGSPDEDLQTTPASTAGANGDSAFMRFKVHQRVLQSFSGTLAVTGEGFEESIPVSAGAGTDLDAFVLLPEQTGEYRLELRRAGREGPVLWVEGRLTRREPGVYQHRLLKADADPEMLALSPGEAGMVLDLGSVRGHLASCITLQEPVAASFRLGVDSNGDGTIAPKEEVTRTVEDSREACIETEESGIPLTARYTAEVRRSDGSYLAYNRGLYDFLDKAGVDSDKDAKPKFVHAFRVTFVRTPQATSVQIKNAAIRPPQVTSRVVPRKEERTDDIIRHGTAPTPTPAVSLSTPTPGTAATATVPAGPGEEQGAGGVEEPGDSLTLNDLLRENWPLLILVTAVVILGLFALREFGPGRSASSG